MSDLGPLPLAFVHHERWGRADFLTSPSNQAAFDAVTAEDAGTQRLALSGPAGSGKSHLLRVWAEAAGAEIVPVAALDDTKVAALADVPLAIDAADTMDGSGAEALIFHALNLAKAHGTGLMLTGRTPPGRWPVALPDLASRLAALDHVAIQPPDDILLSSILTKLFGDRQLRVGRDAIEYLVRRMARSFYAADLIVDRLDTYALAQGRPITRPLVAALYECDPEAFSDPGDP